MQGLRLNPAGSRTPGSPYLAEDLLDYLEPPPPADPQKPGGPFAAASLIWTLSLDGTAIYAVAPHGAFASDGYSRLRRLLKEQRTEGVERVSIPGIISGTTRLLNGSVVPVIVPDLRGVCSWSTSALLKAVVGSDPAEAATPEEKKSHTARREGVKRFLDRVYFGHRNLGISPQDRAINYAGADALNVGKVFESAIKEELELDTIEVERSPVCRPDSECWDVKILFFFPKREVQTVRKVYRFTIDVSDVIPVMIGLRRSWYVR